MSICECASTYQDVLGLDSVWLRFDKSAHFNFNKSYLKQPFFITLIDFNEIQIQSHEDIILNLGI